MDIYKKNRIISFINETSDEFSQKEKFTHSDIEYLFVSCLNLLDTNHPNQSLKKYFIHPEIVSLLLNELRKYVYDTKELSDKISRLTKKLPKALNKRYIKFRILGKAGYYPKCDLSRDGVVFSNVNNTPTLQTINYYSSEFKYSNFSEVSWLTRKELQAAVCIMLAPESGKPLIYITNNDFIKINEDVIKDIPQKLQSYFLYELVQFKNRFEPLGDGFFGREVQPDVTSYKYQDVGNCSETFNQLIDAFSITDHLLLKTSNYLLKSSMLWMNRLFSEDAIANVFFSLEGCLHLIQKKYGDDSTRLNRKLIKSIFIDNIANGENLYGFIEEGYKKRIDIVHPEPNWGAEWSPFLMADDFYEYGEICIDLLKFILIDKKIE